MYVPGGIGRTVCISTLMNITVATYPRLYVRPLEKHELELVTSTFTMSCNVLLQDCTRHIHVLISVSILQPGYHFHATCTQIYLI
jgi:hypothetical protein